MRKQDITSSRNADRKQRACGVFKVLKPHIQGMKQVGLPSYIDILTTGGSSLSGGQGKIEYRSSVELAGHSDFAPVQLDNGFSNR